jgi:hypothetical protein
MLTHPTLDQLNQLGLFGMAKAFGEAEASTEAAALTHPEWLALLLDREMTYRHDRKLRSSPQDIAMPGYASRRSSGMSITGLRAVSIGRCSRSW